MELNIPYELVDDINYLFMSLPFGYYTLVLTLNACKFILCTAAGLTSFALELFP